MTYPHPWAKPSQANRFGPCPGRGGEGPAHRRRLVRSGAVLGRSHAGDGRARVQGTAAAVPGPRRRSTASGLRSRTSAHRPAPWRPNPRFTAAVPRGSPRGRGTWPRSVRPHGAGRSPTTSCPPRPPGTRPSRAPRQPPRAHPGRRTRPRGRWTGATPRSSGSAAPRAHAARRSPVAAHGRRQLGGDHGKGEGTFGQAPPAPTQRPGTVAVAIQGEERLPPTGRRWQPPGPRRPWRAPLRSCPPARPPRGHRRPVLQHLECALPRPTPRRPAASGPRRTPAPRRLRWPGSTPRGRRAHRDAGERDEGVGHDDEPGVVPPGPETGQGGGDGSEVAELRARTRPPHHEGPVMARAGAKRWCRPPSRLVRRRG